MRRPALAMVLMCLCLSLTGCGLFQAGNDIVRGTFRKPNSTVEEEGMACVDPNWTQTAQSLRGSSEREAPDPLSLASPAARDIERSLGVR